jgi:sortase A
VLLVAELDQIGAPASEENPPEEPRAYAPAPDSVDAAAMRAPYEATTSDGDEGTATAALGEVATQGDAGPGSTPARTSRWDRPPPPKDWRWWVGGVGKIMIATGLLLLGFVAYQLWGTGIETARAQSALENDFEELLAIAPAIDATTATDGSGRTDSGDAGTDGSDTDAPSTGGALADPGDPAAGDPTADGWIPLPIESQNIPDVEGGDALFQLEIPSIGVDNIVVAGVRTSDLKKGPGHFPETPLPGQLGNAAIAGHRTTYGQPFHNVDDLSPGDEIIVTTLTGRYVYNVTGTQIVSPSDYQVVTTVDTSIANLTLTSCHPKWTARQRIIVSSELDVEQSDPVGEPVLNYGRSPSVTSTASDLPDEEREAATDSTPAISDASEGVSSNLLDTSTVDQQLVGVAALNSGAVDADIADAFAEGWFSDSEAWWDIAMWVSILALIWLLCYALCRRYRRYWVGIVAGVVPFVIALFFFYQNVNRLLPPNL